MKYMLIEYCHCGVCLALKDDEFIHSLMSLHNALTPFVPQSKYHDYSTLMDRNNDRHILVLCSFSAIT